MPKYCTHCGALLLTRSGRPAEDLFDAELRRKSKVLRLLGCSACGAAAADRYAEYDGALVLIDLVLQRRAAFRHVLLNGDGRGVGRLILKMALLAVLCDGYVAWASLESKGEFFEQEYQFYGMCAKATFSLLVFLLTALLASCGSQSCQTAATPGLSPCVLGLLLAYSARFCNLAAFLWASPSNDTADGTVLWPDLMWAFIYSLFFVATVRAMQVCQRRSLSSSVIISLVSHLAFLASNNMDAFLNQMSCVG